MTDQPGKTGLLAQRINVLEKLNFTQGLKTDDIYSLNLLQPLLNGYPFLPFTGSSLRPFCLNHIVNDILVNGRKSIIEFGSGISTIIIGRLIKKNNLDAKILSIEHDEGWVAVLNDILKNEKIDDVTQVQYAPLAECKLVRDNNLWYALKPLRKATKGKNFDMVIIDGPPAWGTGRGKARYPALPFIDDKLADNFSIYLDDAIRRGEQSVLQLWQKKYGIQFNITGHTLAYYYRGKAFYTEPFVYY